jgi:SAM-dependent methyltransferase
MESQKKVKVSDMDKTHLSLIRKNVSNFLRKCGEIYDRDGILLDIAPQEHEGAAPYFKLMKIETLDINPNSNATYIADICSNNSDKISDNFFDIVVCTEVLEHTYNPFDAVKEIYRILKPSGLLLASCPFNFRIHGPLPDCWRFTEHGIRYMLNKFQDVKIESLETQNRDLMPIHYTIVARKPK